MTTRKSQHPSIALLFYLALVVFASIADANSHLHLNNNHKRLLKKRAPQLIGPDPLQPSTSRSHGGALHSTTDTETLIPTPTSIIIDSSTSSDSSTTSLASSSSSSSRTSSTASTSKVISTSLSTSSSTLASSSTSSSTTTTQPSSVQTFTQTATLTSSSSTASAAPQTTGGSSDSKKTTTMVIIIIAASVGGVAILWTLFRKWKLGRSSKFDERLQPIDWQPPSAGEVRHQGPTSESSVPGADHGRNTSSDHGHAGGRLTPLPDHDFTPLPANLSAPVGTYAELARGPTPRPQMQEAFGGHNPAMARPAYDVNVPLHHQAGYGGHDGYDYTQYHGAHARY